MGGIPARTPSVRAGGYPGAQIAARMTMVNIFTLLASTVVINVPGATSTRLYPLAGAIHVRS